MSQVSQSSFAKDQQQGTGKNSTTNRPSPQSHDMYPPIYPQVVPATPPPIASHNYNTSLEPTKPASHPHQKELFLHSPQSSVSDERLEPPITQTRDRRIRKEVLHHPRSHPICADQAHCRLNSFPSETRFSHTIKTSDASLEPT
jgi:hypothetical protein